MLTNSSLILGLFILPEVKDFNNLKICDILTSDKLSEPEISDSISVVHPTVCYLDRNQTYHQVQNLWYLQVGGIE